MSPLFRSLARSEIDAVLARQIVGRLAYLEGHAVRIEPLHYVWEDGWIYGRTQPGSKLDALAHRPWVAFEVDEVRGLFDWVSVVVHGRFFVLDADGPAVDQARYSTALHAIRRLVPASLSDADPVPGRSVLFAIPTDDADGRSATPTS
jgi:uncharacterized protein